MATRFSANDDRLPLIQGQQGRYYMVDGFKYDEHFPQEWARDHKLYFFGEEFMYSSGPKGCGNCNTYGSINGVFVFYCANCFKNLYSGSRGGFIYCSDDTTEEELWREMPYMNGVKFSEIGDAKCPTHVSEEEPYYGDEDQVLAVRRRFKKKETHLLKQEFAEKKHRECEAYHVANMNQEIRNQRVKINEKIPYVAETTEENVVDDAEANSDAYSEANSEANSEDMMPYIYYAEEGAPFYIYCAIFGVTFASILTLCIAYFM